MGIWQVEGETGKVRVGRVRQDCSNRRFQRETGSLSGGPGFPPTSLVALLSPFFAGLSSAAVPHELVAQGSGLAAFPSNSSMSTPPNVKPLGCSLLGPTCVSSPGPGLLSTTQMSSVPPVLYLGEWGPHPPCYLSQRIL